jgi:hypothetical protein
MSEPQKARPVATPVPVTRTRTDPMLKRMAEESDERLKSHQIIAFGTAIAELRAEVLRLREENQEQAQSIEKVLLDMLETLVRLEDRLGERPSP